MPLSNPYSFRSRQCLKIPTVTLSAVTEGDSQLQHRGDLGEEESHPHHMSIFGQGIAMLPHQLIDALREFTSILKPPTHPHAKRKSRGDPTKTSFHSAELASTKTTTTVNEGGPFDLTQPKLRDWVISPKHSHHIIGRSMAEIKRPFPKAWQTVFQRRWSSNRMA